MNKNDKLANICLLYDCHVCCNPVKIDSRQLISSIPNCFVELENILVPIAHPDTIRLKTYRCLNFNQKTGLCNDYDNRPKICVNTKCTAFHTVRRKEQLKIINKLKSEKFLRISIIRPIFVKEVMNV